MFPYDSALLSAVEPPPQSIEDVVRILQAIEAASSDNDGLKWFNWLYLQVTKAVQARVESKGFDDPVWVAALDVKFAPFLFSRDSISTCGCNTPGMLAGRVRPADPAGDCAHSVRICGDEHGL